jgi:hypothetical protein
MTRNSIQEHDPIIADILFTLKTLIGDNVNGTTKIYKHSLYDMFFQHFPIQYQRNDKPTIDFNSFCEIVKNLGIISNHKMNYKRNKIFKIINNRVIELLNKKDTYANRSRI